MGGLVGGVGEVFAEPFLTIVAAFDADHDHFLAPAVQEIFQSPGFSVGGIFVAVQVVAVEEVHDGIPFPGFEIIVGKIDVQRPVGALGGIDEVALDDHRFAPLSYYWLIITGNEWKCNIGYVNIDKM